MDRDAYPDDMARFLRLSDEDVELLFRGLPPGRDEDLRDLADFLSSATEALARPPRKDVEAEHLALLAEAVRSRSGAPNAATRTEARVARSRERRGLMRLRTVRWAARFGVATTAVVLMTAALAFAGVDLPSTAAETAFQKVLGVDLPNQSDAPDPAQLPPDASDTARRVLTVIQEWRSGAEWTGCEFGARFSHAARRLEGEPDTSRCEGGGAGGPLGSNGAGVGPSGNSEAGLGRANDASDGAASNGAEHAGEGQGIADEASSGAAGAANGDAGSNAGS
jgi:hypothetical protein